MRIVFSEFAIGFSEYKLKIFFEMYFEVVEFKKMKECIIKLCYNFKTIDVEKINFEKINNNNPLKLVFKMAKRLLETSPKDEKIYKAKIKLAEELANYDKVKDNEQIKALVDFLEYLFLIQDPKLEKKYEEYKREKGGALKMTIEEIRRLHYKQEGKEEVRV
ncbi:hypothetical protein [Clostridium gasigenes]|uniref:hypothetical protein n=1 Tax=Clostridium gasigenes TaxID=94869 RepID=UPI001FACF9D1|nr:hypothetical protein [Clostridium gasigenes]